MSTILFSAFAFIITISFLVLIHEYGHFWVARRFGVRIEKFSIGFGRPIIKWYGKRDRTEYSLSWLPLGGYVKMYGETSHEPNAQQKTLDLSLDKPDTCAAEGSFSALPPFKRLLIALAGPAVNLIFAILALWLLFVIGVPANKATIGSVAAGTPMAQANIHSGDQIIAINDKNIDSLTDAVLTLVSALGNKHVPLIARDQQGHKKTAILDLSTYQAGNEMAVEQLVGFKWAIVEAINNQPVILELVSKDSPAENSGLLAGDKILAIEKQPIKNWKDFVLAINNNPETALQIDIKRKGLTQSITLVTGKHPKDASKGYAGVRPQIPSFEALRDIKRYGAFEALPKSLSANYQQAELMLKTLGRLAIGKASVENLGGPLSIADYSGKTLSAGYVTYFHFLASLSLILAVMNLLPIPVLDGGHIIMCAVEIIRGKPLSNKVADILMRLGFSLLATFMLFVLSMDVWRYLFK